MRAARLPVIVLLANQPDAGRSMCLASAVSSAIVALDAKTRRWGASEPPSATMQNIGPRPRPMC